MSSSEDNESDELTLTPPEIQEAARAVIENLLPPKSKEKYLKTYENFVQWKNERKSKSLSENVFLAYFGELAKKVKPTTLWVIYSMLKCTVLMKHDVNLKQYANLTSMLKRQSDGYKCKKSKVFTASNVKMFLFEAPDSVYLHFKVILIFGIFGACRCNEITNITIKDVENHDGVIIVTLRDTKTKIDRTFVIRDESAEIVQKYIALRPTEINTDRFFLNYKNNKCTKQVIGRHKIAAMPKAIATYLNLPNPENYTGHCFRRSSATLLADTGANLITLKRLGGWKSDRDAESYIEESIENKTEEVLSSMTSEMSSSQKDYGKAQILETKEFNTNECILSRSPSEGFSGSQCNECLCNISGFRYTCVQCSDWELCGQCEQRGAHAHHYVLRVPSSATRMESREVKEKIYDSLIQILRSQETPVTTQVKEEYPEVAVKEEFIEEDNFENQDLNFYPDSAPHCSSSLPIETEVDVVFESIKRCPDPLKLEKEESGPNRAHVEQFSLNGIVVKNKGEDQNKDSKPIKVSGGKKPFVQENPIVQTQNELSYLIEEDCGVSSHSCNRPIKKESAILCEPSKASGSVDSKKRKVI